MDRKLVTLVLAAMLILSVAIGVSAALAQTADPPLGFCTILPPYNPGWVVTGIVQRPASCPERGKWVMTIGIELFRFDTWSKMQETRNGRSATLYFEGPIVVVYKLFLSLVSRSKPPSLPPLGFCSISPPGNPGWEVEGPVRRPDSCPENGHWAMVIAGQVSQYDTWTAMDLARANRAATLYFEGPCA